MAGYELEPYQQTAVVDREIVIERRLTEKHFSLRDFGAVLRRRKAIALQTFLAVMAIGLLMTLMTRPLYQARTRLLVEGKSTAVAVNNNSDPLSNLFLPAPVHEVDTQVEVLQSANLISKVARQLSIDPKSVRVEVRQLGKTALAELTVTSHSREAAEKFAAALPQVYLRDVKRGRMGEVSTGLSFARHRLAERTAELERAEQALEHFKSQTGVVDTEAERAQDISASAAAQANARQALADAASAQARLEALQASRGRLPSAISSPVTTTNPEVSLLQSRIAGLREERARLLFLFKPGHDEVRKMDVNIAALERRLATTPRTTTTVTRSPNPATADLDAKIADTWAQLRAAQANWDAAAAAAQRLRGNLARYNAIEMKQAQLQRAIAQGRSSVEMLAKSVDEMSLREKAAAAANAPLEIVGASGPAEQVAPRFVRSMIVSLLLASILACAMAFLFDALDDRIKDEREARTVLGLPILGQLRRLAAGPQPVIAAADSRALENYRMLRSNVHFALSKCPERSVQITSTEEGEGKSETAVNLATAMAMENWRVILVDANLSHPQLHQVFRLPSGPGLTDVLAGQSTLESALQPSGTPNLRVLTVGGAAGQAADLLNSPAMNEMMLKLNASADFIVFDGPACLASADAQVLSSKVDGVLYVLKLGDVTRSSAERSLELLQRAEAHVLGIALNNPAASKKTEPARRSVKKDQTDNSMARRGIDSLPIGSAAGGSTAHATAHQTGEDPFGRRATRAHSNSQPHSSSSGGETRLAKRWALLAGLAVLVVFAIQTLRTRAVPTRVESEAKAGAVSATGATVVDAIGEAEQWTSTSKTTGEWHPLSAGETLAAVSGVRTGPDAALLLQLGNGGVLRVGANTQLKLRHLGAEKYAVKVNEGKVWALVKSEPAAASLQVRTPGALVSSESGLFSVASGYGGALTMVSTVKGVAKVRRGDNTISVAKGFALRVGDSGQQKLTATPLQPAARQMWQLLHKQESWPQPGGDLSLDHATVFALRTAATR